MSEIESLLAVIAALENQRPALGDGVVDAALAPLRKKLDALQAGERSDQRKRLTILFADLAGFTPMAEKTDPEDVRAILKAYFERWTACIESREGSVEKLIGDAILAAFGLSSAHEDDPERAIHAALQMQRELQALNAGWEAEYGLKLAMRVGVHTGLVVISRLQTDSESRYEILGEAVNLASRLQTAAAVDTILISQDTYRRVKGAFDLQFLGDLALKGVSEPAPAYQVLRAKELRFRSEPRGVEGVDTPLVGRKSELEQLQAAYRACLEGESRLVVVAGEAGIGKTRLLSEFQEWLDLRSENIWFFKGRAGQSMRSLNNFLLRDLIANRFDILENDSRAEVVEKLESGLAQFVPEQAAPNAHILGAWLGFDLTGSPHLAGMRGDPRQLAERARMVLEELLAAAATTSPVVILLEDLHWADDGSLEAIAPLFARLAGLKPVRRLLIVASARLALFERHPEWEDLHPSAAIIPLSPLSGVDARRLVETILEKVGHLSGGRSAGASTALAAELPGKGHRSALDASAPQALVDLVVKRSEGNPFFLEELIKMFIEQGVISAAAGSWEIDPERAGSFQVPPSLTEVLQARLDNLPGPAKSTLQRASVVGRVFWEKAVARLFLPGSEAEHDLPAELVLLQRRELIFRRGRSDFESDKEYIFKHALLRDVTYENILKSERRMYHALVARWLADTAGENGRSDEFAALIGDHFAAADLKAEAAIWYKTAGDRAAAQYANREAARLYGLALDLIPAGDLPARVGMLFAREKVCLDLGDRQTQQADLEQIERLLEQAAGIEPAGPVWVAQQTTELYLRHANLCVNTGEYRAGAQNAQRAAQIAREYELVEQEARAMLGLGIAFWRQSDFDQAIATLEQAKRLAHSAGAFAVEASALRTIGAVYDVQGDYRSASRYLESALELYEKQGDLLGQARTRNSLGVVLYHLGAYEAGLVQLTNALNEVRLVGNRYSEGVALSNIAIILQAQGMPVEAGETYRECLEICREIDDPEGEAAAVNGLGTVAYQLGRYREAGENFSAALEICRRIGDEQGEAGNLAALGCLQLAQNRYDAALPYIHAAIDLTRRTNLPFEEAYAQTYLGHVFQHTGRFADAIAAYRAAIELRADHPAQAVDDLAGLAGVYLAQGDLPSALETTGQALDFLDRHGVEGVENPMQVYWTCWQVLQAAGDPRRQTVLKAAVEKLHASAARIPDEETRRAFLENVPANAALIAAWEEAAAQA